MVSDVLAAVRDLVANGRRGALATAISGPDAGTAVLMDTTGEVLEGDSPSPEIVASAVTVAGSGTPITNEVAGVTWFVEPVLPAPRLIVLGAIAIADALVPMAIAGGFAVHVVDMRDWLATPDRYPGAASVRCGVPIEMLEAVGMDEATSVVSFLHEPRLEDPVLMAALQSPARYVGSMGSRRTTAAKRDRLAEAGLAPAAIESLHAPIGLDIGSRTPQEIAVSVLAEVVAAGRGRV